MSETKRFKSHAEAQEAVRKLKEWPERRVICFHAPGDEDADLTGAIY